jgi:hypothetical protein
MSLHDDGQLAVGTRPAFFLFRMSVPRRPWNYDCEVGSTVNLT